MLETIDFGFAECSAHEQSESSEPSIYFSDGFSDGGGTTHCFLAEHLWNLSSVVEPCDPCRILGTAVKPLPQPQLHAWNPAALLEPYLARP